MESMEEEKGENENGKEKEWRREKSVGVGKINGYGKGKKNGEVQAENCSVVGRSSLSSLGVEIGVYRFWMWWMTDILLMHFWETTISEVTECFFGKQPFQRS